MRITGGSLRGRQILPPAGYKARPTTDFAREGMFNTLLNEFDFEELSVLDLFGGTGSISFEFASRGASDIICVEMNPVNSAFISRTMLSLGLKGKIQVVHNNVFDFLGICSRTFDIVFADPPYALEGLDTIPDKALKFVRPGGYLILEHPADYSFAGHDCFVKEKKYGNVHFSYFRGKNI